MITISYIITSKKVNGVFNMGNTRFDVIKEWFKDEEINKMTVYEFAEYLEDNTQGDFSCNFCAFVGECSEQDSCIGGIIEFLNKEV